MFAAWPKVLFLSIQKLLFFRFRILEFESHNVSKGSKTASSEVELWDCAGDFK